MNDESELLRDVRSGPPEADEETVQRVYGSATASPRSPWDALRNRLQSTRRLRLGAAITVVGVATVVVGTTATTGGGALPRGAAVRSGVDSVLAQVQSAFHDGRLISASVQGSELTVTLTTTGPAAITIGTFEAQVLAFAVNEWMQANHEQPISLVSYVDSAGREIQEAATGDAVGGLPSAPVLASGACQAAATNAQSPLSVVSARQIPFAGGTCLIRLQTSDVTTFGASARNSLGAVQSAGSAAGDHLLLVEVVDQSGNPLVITTWAPGIDGVAQSGTWVKSGFDDAGLDHNY